MATKPTFQRLWGSHLGGLALLLAAACTGSITDPGDTGNGTNGGNGPGNKPTIQGVPESVGGSTQMRRLTQTEYNNTVRDLLGDTSLPALAFAADEKSLGMAIGGKLSDLLGEQYQDASEKLAANAVQNLDTLLPCDPAQSGDDACAAAFIDDFVPRAFRRPLTDEERTRLNALYSTVKTKYDFKTGVEIVVRAALQSPHFLYLVEFGADGPDDGRPLTQHELASRMSYFLWSSMPDGELLTAANNGELTGDTVEEHARRLLADSRAGDTVRSFHRQWLELEHLDSMNKDSDYYPSFTDALGAAMGEETERFAEYVVLQDGSLASLLTSNETFVNADLAALYGVPAPTSGWQKVTLPADKRAGLLTQASFLASKSHPNQTSPILRGKFVREALFCQIIDPPPPTVEIEIPPPDPNATTKEHFAQHSSDPACANCHKMMDPIGFGFENYDGIGEYRAKENGITVDGTGELVETDVDGSFDGPVELSKRLAESDQVRDCVTRMWFRFALKRGEDNDEYSVLQAREKFAESGYDIRELMIALVTSHGFQYRRGLEAK